MSVHNGGRHLKGAVESVLRQTYQDFEFLIVDDGSTDGSTEYLESLSNRDSRVRLFRQEKRGLVISLNRLIKESRGELLARMDADDISLPDRFQAQVEQFENDPELGVLGGQIEIINDLDEVLREQRYPLTAKECEGILLYGCPVAHPAVMMSRKVVEGVGGYREFFHHSEDYDLWLRISERAPIENLDRVILRYRTHENSVSSAHSSQQLLGTFLAQAAWLKRLRGEADPVNQWTEISEQTLLDVDLPPEEKCLLLARWRLAVINSLDHAKTHLVEQQVQKFPIILPEVRQKGRQIKRLLYRELTYRAWLRRDLRRVFQYGFVLLYLAVICRTHEFLTEKKRRREISP